MKTINWILTANKWERGTDIAELMKRAKRNMGITTKTPYVRYIGVTTDEATTEELDNLQRCWNVTDMGGLTFYHNPTDADVEMRKRLFVGWITEEYNRPEKKR